MTPTSAICGLDRCDRPVADALVCSACTELLEQSLANVSSLYAELRTLLARQTALGERGARGSTERPLPLDLRAVEMRWVLDNTLHAWVCRLALPEERRPHASARAPELSLWLVGRMERLRHHPEAVEGYSELLAVVSAVTRLIDRRPDRQFVGVCSSVSANGTICEELLYATPGAGEVRCRTCTTVHDVGGRLEVLRVAVRGVLARPSEISRAVVWLGESVGEPQLSRWVTRGRLVAKGHERIGGREFPLYRIGDVLDLVDER